MRRLYAAALLVLAVCAGSMAAGEVLIYEWRLRGVEWYSAGDNAAESQRRSVAQSGYLVVAYDAASDTYSDPHLIRYWTDSQSRAKCYAAEDGFLNDTAEFVRNNSGTPTLSLFGFWGGSYGEYYSGRLANRDGESLGFAGKLSIASRLGGRSVWRMQYDDGSSSNGSGTARLTLNASRTEQANEKGLGLAATLRELQAHVTDLGYTNAAPKSITAPLDNIQIVQSAVDGTVIGAQQPANGTFLDLQTGTDGHSGKLIFYNDMPSGDTKVSIIPNPDTPWDYTLVLPTSAGAASQVLATDGNGVLSWADKASVVTAGVTSVNGRAGAVTLDKADVGLSNVENTALSTWTGSTNIKSVGTIIAGVWNGSAVPVANGGTGATDAPGARTNLGLDPTVNTGQGARSVTSRTGPGKIT